MTKSEIKQRIEKLKKTIRYHRYLYHILDKQEISSEALDSLKKELFDMEQDSPEFITPDSPTQRVGGKPIKKFKKVKHSVPMLSINDAFGRKDIVAWQERNEKFLSKEDRTVIDYYCELKIDGLAVELIYKDNMLWKGSTRGDGLIGEDVTQNIKTIEAIPLRIREKESILKEMRKRGLSETMEKIHGGIPELIVRGEVFITKKHFEQINKERKERGFSSYANPRNLAAGSIRQLNPCITASRGLDFFAYDMITDLDAKTHQEKHQILEAMGFKVAPYSKVCKAIEDILEFFKTIKTLRKELAYEIDGIVININSNYLFEKLGAIGKSPRGVIALKFPLRQVVTKVLDIKIQIGRTGVLTPVAILEPVRVGGVTISRATLHNEDEIKRLDIRIGDSVIVGRAGDVIPDIIKVLPELRTGAEKVFEMPMTCPSCGTKVVRIRDKVDWRCPNPKCFGQKRRYFHHFVSRAAFNIDGLGPKIVDQLLEYGLVSEPSDLFFLKQGDLIFLERFADKSAGNLIAAIQKSKKISSPRFIFALGIKNVGEETARILANHFGILENLKMASVEDLQGIKDIGPIVAQSIHQWFKDKKHLEFLEKLETAGIILPQKLLASSKNNKSQRLDNKAFVLTGTLVSINREKAKESIRALGGKISNSVSRDTDYLVVGENPGSKLRKAKTLKVKQLSEQRFLKMIE